jgi:hypothetical protein
MAGMPEMQEQFPAGACMPPRRKTKSIFRLASMADMPQMQEQFLPVSAAG